MQIVLLRQTYQRLYDFYGAEFCADGLPLNESQVLLDLPFELVRDVVNFGTHVQVHDFDLILETMIGLQAVDDRGIKRGVRT